MNFYCYFSRIFFFQFSRQILRSWSFVWRTFFLMPRFFPFFSLDFFHKIKTKFFMNHIFFNNLVFFSFQPRTRTSASRGQLRMGKNHQQMVSLRKRRSISLLRHLIRRYMALWHRQNIIHVSTPRSSHIRQSTSSMRTNGLGWRMAWLHSRDILRRKRYQSETVRALARSLSCMEGNQSVSKETLQSKGTPPRFAFLIRLLDLILSTVSSLNAGSTHSGHMGRRSRRSMLTSIP